MTQLLPPSDRLKRPKDRSSLAIILAVLIHVLVAMVIYFTVFNDKESSTEDSLLNNNGLISTSVIEENGLIPLDKKDIAAQSSDLQNNKTNTADIDMTANTENNLTNKNTLTAQQPTSIVQNAAQQDGSASVEQASRLNDSNNLRTNTDLVLDTQREQPEYTLKQTKEYQQLDADIDKDNERLSKLIGEVKKYNQSQIQQYQIDTPSNKSSTATPSVQYDYPVTPLPKTANDNKTVMGSAETDK